MVETSVKGKVLVTGAAGFIGSHLVKAFLDSDYEVRASVRSLASADKIAPLKSFPHQDRLEIIEADLLNEASWEPAVTGCQYVMHAAAPVFPRMPKDESLMVKPMVEGTMAILRACAKHPEIKTVVVTSSEASIVSLNQPDTKVFTEDDWADLTNNTPYAKAKVYSEKAALEFHEKLDPSKRFKLVFINPTYVFGPTLIKAKFASGEPVRQLLTGETKECVQLCLSVVDVRDVVTMHIKAIELPVKDRNRYLCYSGETIWLSDVGKMLRDEFSQYGYKITDKVMEKCPITDKTRPMCQMWGRKFHFSNEKAKKEMEMNFKTAKEAILATAYSMIELGIIPDLIHK